MIRNKNITIPATKTSKCSNYFIQIGLGLKVLFAIYLTYYGISRHRKTLKNTLNYGYKKQKQTHCKLVLHNPLILNALYIHIYL